jgi:Protein of unknown function (DUF1573)
MKRSLFCLVYGVFLLFCTLKCASASRSGTASGRLVKWLQPTEYNFDTVRFGKTVGTVFVFENQGNKPLRLETVRTSCGCTAADWPERAIAPRDTGHVTIEYDADESGPFRKKISVFFDGQRKAEVLWIEGVVE